MKRPGASMGIGTPVEVGNCSCCAFYRAAEMLIWDQYRDGSPPKATIGQLRLWGGGRWVEFELDLTPVYGRLCGEIYYETFTLDFLSGGQVVGKVTYEYLEGWVFSGLGNLIVEIDGHVYKAQNGGISGGTPSGLIFNETEFTEIDGEPQ